MSWILDGRQTRTLIEANFRAAASPQPGVIEPEQAVEPPARDVMDMAVAGSFQGTRTEPGHGPPDFREFVLAARSPW